MWERRAGQDPSLDLVLCEGQQKIFKVWKLQGGVEHDRILTLMLLAAWESELLESNMGAGNELGCYSFPSYGRWWTVNLRHKRGHFRTDQTCWVGLRRKLFWLTLGDGREDSEHQIQGRLAAGAGRVWMQFHTEVKTKQAIRYAVWRQGAVPELEVYIRVIVMAMSGKK